MGRDGNVTVSQGTGPSYKGKQFWSADKSLPQGYYFLWLVETPTGCHVSVYSGSDHNDPSSRKQYDLFDYPDSMTFYAKALGVGDFFYSENLAYRLEMGSDGNLVLSQVSDGQASYKWSLFNKSSELPKGTASASFDSDGRFQIMGAGSSTPAWRSRGKVNLDPALPKSFFLSVDSDGAVGAYQGTGANDPKKKKLYDLYTASK